jgi:hypothetical protein
MAAYGVREDAIARVVGIDPKTLRKHYRDELDTGQVKATAKVAESLFRKATGEGPQSVTAAIFWLKTRGGWRETPQDHQSTFAMRAMFASFPMLSWRRLSWASTRRWNTRVLSPDRSSWSDRHRQKDHPQESDPASN